jgi:hypothetical protein
MRLIKSQTSDLAVLCELDLEYQGGASISLEASLTGGIKMNSKIVLNQLSGKMRVRWPSLQYNDMLGICFVQDPGVSFKIEGPLSSKTSESLRSMVNRFLETMARKLFLEMWVLPSWRNFYMPMMNPNLDVQIEREKKNLKEKKLAQPTLRSAIANKAATLWEAHAPLLKLKNVVELDYFHNHENVFSIHQETNEQSINEYELMEASLVTGFLELARSDVHLEILGDESSGWKLLKRKGAVEVYKQTITKQDKLSDIVRGSFTVQCESLQVFSVLRNPEHYKHVCDFFVDFFICDEVGKI